MQVGGFSDCEMHDHVPLLGVDVCVCVVYTLSLEAAKAADAASPAPATPDALAQCAPEDAGFGPPPLELGYPCFNVEHVSVKIDVLKTIKEHAMFQDIANDEPLAISADNEFSGHMAPFSAAEYKIAMGRSKTYTSACNIFHIDMWSAPLGNVPTNPTSIANLKE